jgi:hypothetical protein
MLTQLKTFHLPLHALVPSPRSEAACPKGTLSRAELRRLVADMVD